MALGTEHHSARVSKIKNGGLDQYGAERFKQQQFGTAGVEGVNQMNLLPSELVGRRQFSKFESAVLCTAHEILC